MTASSEMGERSESIAIVLVAVVASTSAARHAFPLVGRASTGKVQIALILVHLHGRTSDQIQAAVG
jgi:hypothetical protein